MHKAPDPALLLQHARIAFELRSGEHDFYHRDTSILERSAQNCGQLDGGHPATKNNAKKYI